MSGMAQVNRAFFKGLAGKASCQGCTMVYERGTDGKQKQRLMCHVTLPNGEQTIVTDLFDGRADLVNAAEKLAGQFASAEIEATALPKRWEPARGKV